MSLLNHLNSDTQTLSKLVKSHISECDPLYMEIKKRYISAVKLFTKSLGTISHFEKELNCNVLKNHRPKCSVNEMKKEVNESDRPHKNVICIFKVQTDREEACPC